MIFARAARNGTRIWARYDRLESAGADEILAALLAVYNRFFAAENRRWLARVQQADARQEAAFYAAYRQESQRYPLAPGFPLYKKAP